jgi:hypothetical protein
MSQWQSRCQSRAAQILVTGLLAFASSIQQDVVIAQQRSKPEAEAVAIARQAVAARLSLPIERLEVVSVAAAQWRDSSLGCPERGMRYRPVLSEGYDVRLRDAEREHRVHVAGGRAVICGTEDDPKLSPAPLISDTLKAADSVRAALAKRLGIPPARVRIVSTRPARSASPPCAAAPEEPKGAAFVVEAEANSQAFRYYADQARVVNCDDAAGKRH